MSERDAALADALLSAGRWRDARDAAMRALQSDPRDGSARLTLASALQGLREYDAAFDEVSALVADEPDNATALRLLAIVAERTGRPRRGLDAANAAVERDPHAWNGHAILAFAEVHANGGAGAERAIAAAQRAIELAPHAADPHEALGTVYLLLGRWRKSEAALRVALAIDPGHARARQNLGVVLQQQGKLAAAMNLFAGLTADHPTNPVHTRNIASVFRRGVKFLLLACVLWAMIGLRFPPPNPPPGGAPPPIALVYALTLPALALIALALFAVRFRYGLGALWGVLRRDAVPSLWVVALMVVAFLQLLVGIFLTGTPRSVLLGGSAAVVLTAGCLAFWQPSRRARKNAAPEVREDPRPLTFREDLVRAIRQEPAPRRIDGKPAIQPWAVGPGRIIGFACALLSFVPIVGVAFGLLGFALSNTAWAHLRNAGLPRRLPLAGQIVSAVGVALGIAFIVVLIVTIPHR